MTLRMIPDSMDRHVVGQIDAELDRIERDYPARVRLAIESGSRAWGFPSPDSDYDCRFLYVSDLEVYLSPWRSRDVIETPLVGLLDVNGWDLAKALRLLTKGNAVVIEWLSSPIVYRGDRMFREELLRLAHEVADRDRIARHYLHLGAKHWAAFERHGSLKKVFYSLRPAMALRWLHEHPDAAVAPMHLPTLTAACSVPASLSDAVTELIELKSRTREMGQGEAPAPIRDFIVAEFDRAAAQPRTPSHIPEASRAATAEFFRREALRLHN